MENNYTAENFSTAQNPSQSNINQIDYQTDCLEADANENNIDYENAFGEFDCAGL